jgi:PIN domain-containing protein
VRLFFDHNISPAMARAFRELFRGEHEATTLAEKFRPDVPDVHWIKELSDEGNWIIISGDRRITRNRAEYNTFRNSNLIGLFLSPGLCKSKVTKQMERILALWENIETVTRTVAGGAMFELPTKSNRLRQLKL